MNIFTTYKRLKPSTVNGDAISITTVYSSFNPAEIDELEQHCKATIGTGVIQHFDPADGEMENNKK